MKKSSNIISGIICTILCVALFAFENSIVVTYSLTNFLTTKSLTESVKDLDLLELLSDNQTTGAIDSNRIEFAEGYGNTPLGKVYNQAETMGISKDTVDKVINSNATKEIIGEYLGTNIDSILNGTETAPISGEEIANAINNNLDEIAKENNITLTDNQKNKINTIVNDNSDAIASRIPEPTKLANSINPSQLKTMRFLLSNQWKMIITIGAILCFILILVLRKSIFKFAKWTGTTTILAGISSLIIGIGIHPIFNFLSGYAPTYLIQIINTFIDKLGSTISMGAIILLIFGIIQLLYANITPKLIKKKA